MGRFGLEDWKAVAARRAWPALLLGNGASIAVSDAFQYSSLFTVAPLTIDDCELFDALETTNFEEVLNYLDTAELICDQLRHASADVRSRHKSIRAALIQTVDQHHVDWPQTNAGDRLERIRDALGQHNAVFSTNYDLIVYWAIMDQGGGADFGDLFWNSAHTFDPLDTEAWNNKTVVYWLHGGLHLYRNRWGETTKRTNDGVNLLEAFARAKEPALFVSEGTWKRKRRAIRRSDYLEHCYVTLSENDDNVLVFGHSLAPQDRHLIKALRRVPRRHMAYSIYPDTQRQVNLERARIEEIFPNFRIRFFDSTTHPLGDPALRV